MIRSQRKAEHIAIAARLQDGPSSSGFQDIHMINCSVPELDLADIDLSTSFAGKPLQVPLIINALTGGTPQAERINAVLAELAGCFGMGMAVGSQTIALHDPGLTGTFTVVRDVNPQGLIIANVSAGTLPGEAIRAVDMIQADALQLHFNIPQEMAMPEGDRCFKGLLDNVARIVDLSSVPIIAKEVGFGFSREAIQVLYEAGVRIFDTGGKGGTNFVVIEDNRDGNFGHELDEWGITSAVSLAEVLDLKLPAQVIASGGIRTALDAVKSLAMGADLVGIAGLFLKILLHDGAVKLEKSMEEFIYRLKAVFLMSGALNIHQIRQKPLVILGETADWLTARGIDRSQWARR